MSSDWEVHDISPFVGIQNLIHGAAQALPSVEDAVKLYTINGAYTMRQETTTGSIETDKFAYFIIVDQDIFTIPTNTIGQTKVLNTWLGGKEVYNHITSATQNPQGGYELKIFPNPANHQVKINISDLEASVLSIYSVNGKLMDELNAENKDTIVVDISNYQAGLYIVELLMKNGGKGYSKIVKN